MVGGGEGAFIGAVHRIAARLDDHYELVAGALAGDPDKAQRSGLALGLDPARSYGDFMAMAKAEAARADGIEAVAIVTPNHLHAPVARAFMAHGVHIICDKPLTATLPDALALQKDVDKSGVIFALTHNYSAYPLIRQARAMVAAGEIGAVRVVQVEYPQDWLTGDLESTGQKQADWRTDPARSGAGGCVGDIGTHAFQLARFVNGLQVERLLAELSTFVPGRRLDDNAQVLLRFDGGARGALWASQVAVGNDNALKLRVFGGNGGLEWRQEEPNSLSFARHGEPQQTIRRAGAGADAAGARLNRIPAGHPEGYLEGFANLYSEAAAAILARRSGAKPAPDVSFPGIADGVEGVRFVDAAVRSSSGGGVWVTL